MKLQLQINNAPVEDYFELVAVLSISNNVKNSVRDTQYGLVPLSITEAGDRILYATSKREIDEHKLTPKQLKRFIHTFLDSENPELLCFKEENGSIHSSYTKAHNYYRRHFLLIKHGDNYGLTTVPQLKNYTYKKPIHAKVGKMKKEINMLDYCELIRKG